MSHLDIISVILVDDHPVVRTGIRQILGYATDIAIIGECGGGYDAITLILKLQPTIVVLNVNLPDISGIGVIQQLKASGYTGHILLLSAYNDGSLILEALKQGAVGYLTKDEILTTLGKAIRDIAHGEVNWLIHHTKHQTLQYSYLDSFLDKNPLSVPSHMLLLSSREQQVLRELASGSNNRQIAHKLTISEGTVKNHITAIYSKISVCTRAEAVAWAWQHGFVYPNLSADTSTQISHLGNPAHRHGRKGSFEK